MDKSLYQIKIVEYEVNDYILGRISGILDICVYAGDKVKSADVLHGGHEWWFNCEMNNETFDKVRSYITKCYPNFSFKYYKIINKQKIEL